MNNNIFFKTLLLKGEAGQSIGSIEKTATSGVVDTYTITLTDGTTTSFNVTNGTSIANIALTSSSGLVDTYTITLTDGSTTTFNVTNGEDYTVPTDGILFYEGVGVPDGYEASDPPMAKSAVEMSYARYQTLTEAEKTDGTIYMVYDDPTDNYVANNGFYLNYSTDEQLTGQKWIDGKPIYQKTFNLTFTTNQLDVDLTALSVESVVKIDGGVYNLSGSFVPFGYESAVSAYTTTASNIHINNIYSSERTNGYVTLQYTKTTDTV